MKIRCNKRQREMNFAELLGYLEVYLIKVLESVMVNFIVQMAKDWLSILTRGVVDDQMASLANNFKISCPNCESIGHWDPAPEINKVKNNKKTKNSQINSGI